MSGLTRRRFFSAASCLVGSSAIRGAAGHADQGTVARSSVTITVADYVRYMPFSTGEIRANNMALTVLRGDRSEMLRRATSDPSVHGGETSMAQHVVRLDRGDRSLVAVPVFPLRNFTARDFYTSRGSTLTIERLDGQRVGIYNWVATTVSSARRPHRPSRSGLSKGRAGVLRANDVLSATARAGVPPRGLWGMELPYKKRGQVISTWPIRYSRQRPGPHFALTRRAFSSEG